MRYLLVVYSLLTSCLAFSGGPLHLPSPVPLTLSYARTHKEQVWGFMRRSSLLPNEGLLFSYSVKQPLSFWMFNCFTDLEVAFLDEERVLCEIYPLKAYPEKMDPKRQIASMEDLKLYPYSDPICQFFLKEAVHSQQAYLLALELPQGFLHQHHVKEGWALSLKERPLLIPPLELGLLDKDLHFLLLEKESSFFVKASNDLSFYLYELNEEGQILNKTEVKKGLLQGLEYTKKEPTCTTLVVLAENQQLPPREKLKLSSLFP